MSVYVLDASVARGSRSPGEPFHQAARARLASMLAGLDSIVVPASFDIEVTSALVRRGSAIASVREYLERDLAAREIITIGPRAARAISGVAARTRLRAADAVYVWVASSRGLPFVTLDREIAQGRNALSGRERLVLRHRGMEGLGPRRIRGRDESGGDE